MNFWALSSKKPSHAFPLYFGNIKEYWVCINIVLSMALCKIILKEDILVETYFSCYFGKTFKNQLYKALY